MLKESKIVNKPKILQLKQNTPAWLIKFSVIIQILLIISFFLSYKYIPHCYNEPMMRANFLGVKNHLSSLRAKLNNAKNLPGYQTKKKGEGNFTTFDETFIHSLQNKDSGVNPDIIEDSFSTKPIKSNVFLNYVKFFYFYTWKELQFISKEKQEFHFVQYFSDGKNYLVWSRGPDYKFDIFLNEDSLTTRSLENYLTSPEYYEKIYDPTNGIFSSGDITRTK